MPEPTNETWKERFRARFAEYPTSFHWYGLVQGFIEETVFLQERQAKQKVIEDLLSIQSEAYMEQEPIPKEIHSARFDMKNPPDVPEIRNLRYVSVREIKKYAQSLGLSIKE